MTNIISCKKRLKHQNLTQNGRKKRSVSAVMANLIIIIFKHWKERKFDNFRVKSIYFAHEYQSGIFTRDLSTRENITVGVHFVKYNSILLWRSLISSISSFCLYGRVLVALTQMARLPRLFRTRSWVHWKKSHSCRLGIIQGDIPFILKMVNRVYSLESPRWGDSNENTQYIFMLKKIEMISLFCLLT